MTGRSATVAAIALRPVADGRSVVPVQIEGAEAWVLFEIDPVEHARRSAAGAGAVTSTALLHGLWLLPEGGWVNEHDLPEAKARLLVETPHVTQRCGQRLSRTFSPAGRISAVAFGGRSLAAAVARAVRYPPTWQRWVFGPVDPRRSSAALAEAREWNVGVISTTGGDGEVVVPAPVPGPGVPAVYRWWLAECAYESWLYRNAQASSCALGSTGPCMPARP